MRMIPLKSVAWMTALAFFCVSAFQPSAQAMLIPAQASRTQSDIVASADMQTIQKTLESKVLRAKLHALGLSDEEIQSRLSRLSDTQKHQLASQIRAVNPAGDLLIGVLVFVVLVLLIIFLIKRIL